MRAERVRTLGQRRTRCGAVRRAGRLGGGGLSGLRLTAGRGRSCGSGRNRRGRFRRCRRICALGRTGRGSGCRSWRRLRLRLGNGVGLCFDFRLDLFGHEINGHRSAATGLACLAAWPWPCPGIAPGAGTAPGAGGGLVLAGLVLVGDHRVSSSCRKAGDRLRLYTLIARAAPRPKVEAAPRTRLPQLTAGEGAREQGRFIRRCGPFHRAKG